MLLTQNLKLKLDAWGGFGGVFSAFCIYMLYFWCGKKKHGDVGLFYSSCHKKLRVVCWLYIEKFGVTASIFVSTNICVLFISFRLQTQVPDLNSSLEMVTMLTSKKVLSCLVTSLINTGNLKS